MIVDCHGHYTTTPPELAAFRDAQKAWMDERSGPPPELAPVSDDKIRESIEENQLRVLLARGADLTIFSPKALGMEHHLVDQDVATAWARTSNDLVHRVVEMFPDHFAGVCQLPQTPGGSLDPVVDELTRCVEELGFVGCNLNPDPSGGRWSAPPLFDPSWFPLFERMVELDVPAMIHVSASCTSAVHATGAHYLNGDTTVFMQLIEGDLFTDFPTLRFVIPHGGGAVPYHWGRYRGLASRMGRPPVDEHLLGNVFFDTSVYHQPGIDLLFEVVPVDNILFASEMLGAIPDVVDPDTGLMFDDTKRYIDAVELSEEDRRKVFEGNARRVYPRLEARVGPRSG